MHLSTGTDIANRLKQVKHLLWVKNRVSCAFAWRAKAFLCSAFVCPLMKGAWKDGFSMDGLGGGGRKLDVISRSCSCSEQLLDCLTFGQKRKLLASVATLQAWFCSCCFYSQNKLTGYYSWSWYILDGIWNWVGRKFQDFPLIRHYQNSVVDMRRANGISVGKIWKEESTWET